MTGVSVSDKDLVVSSFVVHRCRGAAVACMAGSSTAVLLLESAPGFPAPLKAFCIRSQGVPATPCVGGPTLWCQCQLRFQPASLQNSHSLASPSPVAGPPSSRLDTCPPRIALHLLFDVHLRYAPAHAKTTPGHATGARQPSRLVAARCL